ncbi:MAG: hypothetical protein JWO94_1846, partial [Verrucomicrobiaceae bacterium]|nr:hypothetical protein [Verrucomicrobiaceae bacterium]
SKTLLSTFATKGGVPAVIAVCDPSTRTRLIARQPSSDGSLALP